MWAIHMAKRGVGPAYEGKAGHTPREYVTRAGPSRLREKSTSSWTLWTGPLDRSDDQVVSLGDLDPGGFKRGAPLPPLQSPPIFFPNLPVTRDDPGLPHSA